MPFPVKAIQVDGGAEFETEFERGCEHRGIRLFILPPHSLELNGYVERADRTHTEKFYEVVEVSFDVAELRAELMQWKETYNKNKTTSGFGLPNSLRVYPVVAGKITKGGYVSLMY